MRVSDLIYKLEGAESAAKSHRDQAEMHEANAAQLRGRLAEVLEKLPPGSVLTSYESVVMLDDYGTLRVRKGQDAYHLNTEDMFPEAVAEVSESTPVATEA